MNFQKYSIKLFVSNNESRNSDQINETTQHLLSSQSVCYSQKLHGKRDFPNLANKLPNICFQTIKQSTKM